MRHIKNPKESTYYLVYANFTGLKSKEVFLAQYTEDGEWDIITGITSGIESLPVECVSHEPLDNIFKLTNSEILLNVVSECA